jgi:hypothetical protein
MYKNLSGAFNEVGISCEEQPWTCNADFTAFLQKAKGRNIVLFIDELDAVIASEENPKRKVDFLTTFRSVKNTWELHGLKVFIGELIKTFFF